MAAVLATYSIALIVAGHGVAPMPVILYFGLGAMFGKGDADKVFIVSSVVGLASLVLLVLAPVVSRVWGRNSAAIRVLVVIGLYGSWAIPAGVAAYEESGGDVHKILPNFSAELMVSAPFQITVAVVLYFAWRRLRAGVIRP
ncbi:hypothetical protein [Pseudoxanthomonas sp. JBR18]|uniref:hypothetical protein n=1 Tax=Pseudoxanthomonas sp. JBR18 TaxID=2969308 RepID=UPI0023050636|nr:hypothetical protein [Pseudoxanthomonas sp. JBR18]WCE04914.1 hypothetical protein PJ250_02685 [Pseudoxanthomonas sp. JBR18]